MVMKTTMSRIDPRELDSRRREFGAILRRLRRDQGLTCEELAKRAGKLSRSTLAAIERGSRPAGAKVGERLADALRLEDRERDGFVLASLRTTTGEILPWSSHGLNPELFQPLARLFRHNGIHASDNYRVQLEVRINSESPVALKRAAILLAEQAEKLSRRIRGALNGLDAYASLDTKIECGDGKIILVEILASRSNQSMRPDLLPGATKK